MNRYRQPCDSYFIESHTDYDQQYREELREREKYFKRQRQLHIAENLSELASVEYREDILRHMEHMERDTLPDVASIDVQTEIKWYMRPYLVDFLIEAHNAFGLLPETLFLAVNLLDRYCSRRVVYKRHYQLVGCAALLIASKYGDCKERVPTIKELRQMCCSLYEDEMFTQMEWHVLETVGWVIGHPSVDAFLQLAMETAPNAEVEQMARYIAEVALFHRDFVSTLPSHIARAALTLARCVLGMPQPTGEWAGIYDTQTLVTLSQHLHGASQILFRKYSTLQHCRVSTILDRFLEEQATVARQQPETTPLPPKECPATNTEKKFYAYPQTPVKVQSQTTMPYGCPTPPITPTKAEEADTKLTKAHHAQLVVAPVASVRPTIEVCHRPPTPTYAEYSYQYSAPPRHAPMVMG